MCLSWVARDMLVAFAIVSAWIEMDMRVADDFKACPDRFVLKGGFCQAPPDAPGRCGFTLSSKYNSREKAAYAEACLTPWPCGGIIVG